MGEFNVVLPTLINQLKSILDQYQDDGQILKELIQNAEDASARTVKFLLDERSFKTEHLLHQGLSQYQGPALYAFNDALFTDDDWTSLKHWGNSIKKDDVSKVGRFGLGFKSVFHMTDLPVIMSGYKVCAIDPQELYFMKDGYRLSGYMWDINDNADAITTTKNQFEPLENIFDKNTGPFEGKRGFKGTLFRFPLRQKPSMVCDNVYDAEKVRTLFTAFQKAAEEMLVFLMSVERIEIYVREATAEKPTLVFSISVQSQVSPGLYEERQKFLRTAKGIFQKRTDESNAPNKKTIKRPLKSVQVLVLKRSTPGVNEPECITSSTYLVSHYSGWASPEEHSLQKLISKKLSYLPWASTAARLLPSDATEPQDWKTQCPEPHGQLFCFLPLPLQTDSPTGLPVHVNGFFALSSSRHEVKWPSIYDSETSDDACLWNKYLVENIVPRAYANMAIELVKKISYSPRSTDGLEKTTRHAAYSLFPDLDLVADRWKGMLNCFYRLIFEECVTFVHADDGGKWVRPRMTLLPDPDEDWRTREVTARCLATAALPDVAGVASVPAHVLKAIEQHVSPAVTRLTPAALRTALRRAPRTINRMSNDDRLTVLEFILKANDDFYQELVGLPLLPLMDGSFASFASNSGSAPVYMSSAEHPHSLLPRSSSLFLDNTERLTDELKKMLTAVANSKLTNLCHFNEEHFKLRCHSMVTIDDVTQRCYSELLWEYLLKHFATNLSDFEDLPLILCRTESAATQYVPEKLSRDRPLLIAQSDAYQLNENTCNALRRMGVIVVSSIAPFIWNHAAVRESYVFDASPFGILAVLCILERKERRLPEKFKDLIDNERSSLLEELDRLDDRRQYTREQIHLLKLLPLFELKGQPGIYASVSEVQEAAPLNDHPALPPSCRLLDTKASSLLTILGVRRLGRAELFEKHLRPLIEHGACNREYIDRVMIDVLRNLSDYEKEDSSFVSRLSSLPFVSRQDGEIVTASYVFDPFDAKLKAILFGNKLYPSTPYDDRTIIQSLLPLGLRNSDSMTEKQLLECAQSVYKLYKICSSELMSDIARKSRSILQFLEDHEDCITERTFELLKTCRWLIPLSKPSEAYPSKMTWLGGQQEPTCPCDIYDICYGTVVGSCAALVPYSVKPTIAAKFGWDKPPPSEVILKHLRNVIEEYRPLEKAAFLPMVCGAYEILQNCCDKEIQKTVLTIGMKEWVWHGEGFAQPRAMILESTDLGLKPYIHVVPNETRKYNDFFKRIGVLENLSNDLLLDVLRVIKEKHASRNPPIGEQAQRDYCVAENIVRKLAVSWNDLSSEAKERILGPDEHGNGGKVDQPDSLTRRLNRLLQSTRESLGNPFGQKEELVDRISRIMTAYPRGKEIFYELIQNADDSGATEIHFIKDYRNHPTEMVFEDSWKPLQGPALCVFNNKSFTQSDLRGIQLLGLGSKSLDPNKTGQYGVGFNSVYHLTDVPSFLTTIEETKEQVLCVLDPNCCYIPGATLDRPGRQYTALNELRAKYPDVFSCYLENLISLDEGTLFRFPLRTTAMAAHSKLRSKALSMKDMNDLLETLKAEMFEVLLFVNNLTQIKISQVSADGSSIQTSYGVQATLCDEDARKRSEFYTYVRQCKDDLKDKKIALKDIEARQACYSVVLKDSNNLQETWRVVQRIGFERDVIIHESVERAFETNDLCLLPRGGVAGIINPPPRIHREQRSRRVFCFLPLPVTTGLPVNVNGHFALDYESRRGLWLDDGGGGSRTKWNVTLLQEVVTKSYVALLKDLRDQINKVCSPDTSRDTLDKALLVYYMQYPSFVQEPNKIGIHLSISLYKEIHKDKVPLLALVKQVYNGQKKTKKAELHWLSTTSDSGPTFFDNAGDAEQKSIKEVLVRAGMHWIYAPVNIYEDFKASNIEVLRVTPKDVINFLRECQHPVPLPCALDETIFGDESTIVSVLNYCLKDKFAFCSHAITLPLGLSQDNNLHILTRTKPLFSSEYHDLLPNCADEFLHDSVRTIYERIPEEVIDETSNSKSADPITIRRPAVFKNFDVRDLAQRLHLALDEQFICEDSTPVPFIHDSIVLPNTTWLARLWKFLASTRHFNCTANNNFERQYRELLLRIEGHLHKFALIPAIKETRTSFYQHTTSKTMDYVCRRYLVFIRDGKTVVDYDCYQTEDRKPLKEALRALGVLNLDKTVFDPNEIFEGLHLVKMLTANLKNRTDVLESVHAALRIMAEKQEKFENKEYCRCLLNYFSTELPSQDHETYKPMQWNLRRLPFYETHKGDLVALDDCDVAILFEETPRCDFDQWSGDSRFIFLKSGCVPNKLIEFLQCRQLHVYSVYHEFILPQFANLSVKGREVHLEYIRDKCLKSSNDGYNEERTKLLDYLKQLPFLDKGDGILRKACCFYDPENELLSNLWNANRFPPAPFNSPGWLPFLKDFFELQTKLTNDDFVNLAEEIAHRWKSFDLERVEELAKMLISQMFLSETLDETLMQNIRHIPFICASRVERNLIDFCTPSFDGNSDSPLITFNGSVSYTPINTYCSWSTAQLLPEWADPLSMDRTQLHCKNDDFRAYRNTIAKHLGILEAPSEMQIADHLNNLIRASRESRILQQITLDEVFHEIYAALQKRIPLKMEEKFRNMDCMLLSDPDGNATFVKASQLVLSIQPLHQVHSYIMKTPPSLMEFGKLLIHLGAAEESSVFLYSQLLEQLYVKYQNRPLTLQDLTASHEAVRGLITHLRNKDEAFSIESLYLPSTDGCLYSSKELVDKDYSAFAERLKTPSFDERYLVDLETLGVDRLDFDDAMRKIPQDLRPRSLYNIVEECLCEMGMNFGTEHLSGPSEKLQKLLQSSAFHKGLWRLIMHAHKDCKSKPDNDVWLKIEKALLLIEVRASDKLSTYLKFNGQKMEGSDAEADCFCNKTGVDTDHEHYIIYTRISGALSARTAIRVAEIIHKISDGLLRSSVLYLYPLLQLEPEAIERLLNELRITK